MATPPPVTNRDFPRPERSGWSGKIASGICPGLGQIIEGRYRIGFIQLGLFLSSLFFLAATILIWISNVVGLIYNGDFPVAESRHHVDAVPWIPFITSSIICFGVYVWSIWDAGTSSSEPAD